MTGENSFFNTFYSRANLQLSQRILMSLLHYLGMKLLEAKLTCSWIDDSCVVWLADVMRLIEWLDLRSFSCSRTLWYSISYRTSPQTATGATRMYTEHCLRLFLLFPCDMLIDWLSCNIFWWLRQMSSVFVTQKNKTSIYGQSSHLICYELFTATRSPEPFHS